MTCGYFGGVLGWHSLSKWLPWSIQCGNAPFVPGSFYTSPTQSRPLPDTGIRFSLRDKKRKRSPEPRPASDHPRPASDHRPEIEPFSRAYKRQKIETGTFSKSTIAALNKMCPIVVRFTVPNKLRDRQIYIDGCFNTKEASNGRKIGFKFKLDDGRRFTEAELAEAAGLVVRPSSLQAYASKRDGARKWLRLSELLSKDVLHGTAPLIPFAVHPPPFDPTLHSASPPSKTRTTAQLESAEPNDMDIDLAENGLNASSTSEPDQEVPQTVIRNVGILQRMCPIQAKVFGKYITIVKFLASRPRVTGRFWVDFECTLTNEPQTTFARLDLKEKCVGRIPSPSIITCYGSLRGKVGWHKFVDCFTAEALQGTIAVDPSTFKPMEPESGSGDGLPPPQLTPFVPSPTIRAVEQSKMPSAPKETHPLQAVVPECGCSLGPSTDSTVLARIVAKESYLRQKLQQFQLPKSVFDGVYVNLLLGAQQCDTHSVDIQCHLFPAALTQSLGAAASSLQQCRRILDQVLASRRSVRSFLLFRSDAEADSARKTALLQCFLLSAEVPCDQPLQDQLKAVGALLFQKQNWQGAQILAELLQEDHQWRETAKHRCHRCDGYFPMASTCLLCSQATTSI
jgi:hypothetical protein